MGEFTVRIDDSLLDSLRRGTAFQSDEEMLSHLMTTAIYRSELVTPAAQLILVTRKLEIRRAEQ